MNILCVGGGPGGLYAALLLKKSDPARRITVVDRNPPGATYGWGVVFSDETLGFLEEADPESYEQIEASFVHWEAIDIRFRGQTIRSGGHAFSGMSRKELLTILQQRCASEGVELQFEREIVEPGELSGYDLVIAADGVNSRLRQAHGAVFLPSFDTHATKYIWYGSPLPLEAFTFDFRETEWGPFQVHSYPFADGLSTVIVETDEASWRRAGLDRMDEAQSIAFCRGIFGDFLQGSPLLSNRSTWLNFVTLKNQTWHHKNVVLLGDAAHTAHFSIGSGTKMAMEDAIALTAAVDKHRGSLNRALVEYEEVREPIVERTQAAARDSSKWFEQVRRYLRFEPTQFAFSLLTRSKRITYENLKQRDAHFSYGVDRWFANQSALGSGTSRIISPLLNPLRLRECVIANRVATALVASGTAAAGSPSEETAIRLAAAAINGAGLVLSEPIAVSADGRITTGSSGLYAEEHVPDWSNAIAAARRTTNVRIAARLVHSGRRGATRPRYEGVDLPARGDSWELISASAIPYGRRSRVPRAMDCADLRRVGESYVESTRAAARVGFDLLEIDMAHGYLLHSFLSPVANRRNDEFGGSFENRTRFPLQVLRAVRAAWPDERPLAVRLAATDWIKGGMTEDEAVAFGALCKGAGCDLIHVVSGQASAHSSPTFGRAWQAALSDLMRNEALIPTMCGGNITSADEINTILAAGRADLCVLAPWLPPSPPALLWRGTKR